MALPYDYYPAVLYAIDQIGQGNTLTEACDKANISVLVFKSYVDKDDMLKEMFQDAEQRSYDAFADALINIDNHKIHGQSNPQMAKVISDNIKWVLSKRDPKRFAERVEIKHELTLDRAITDALNAARKRTAIASNDVIDAEVVDDEVTLRDLLA